MYAGESEEFLLGQQCRMKEAFEAVICRGWQEGACTEMLIFVPHQGQL